MNENVVTGWTGKGEAGNPGKRCEDLNQGRGGGCEREERNVKVMQQWN